MRRQSQMDRFKYAHLNPYLSAELARQYASPTSGRKLALLKKLTKNKSGIPDRLFEEALNDPEPAAGDWLVARGFPNDEMKRRFLDADPSGFRRASLIENETF